MVGPEGMEKFCEDIGVEPENASVSLSSVSLSAYLSPVLLHQTFHYFLFISRS